MRHSFVLIVICFLSFNVHAQSIVKSLYKLPDTGETTSYTSTFGEDADYAIHLPYFLQNNNGTVSDTVTRLMWQKADGGEMTITQAIHYCDTLSIGGYTDWRLPTAIEAFSILNQQLANPAIDLQVFTASNAEYWWTSERQYNDTNKIWATNAGGGIGNHPKTETISAGGIKHFNIRAVRDIEPPILLAEHFTDNGDGTVTDHLTDLMWIKTPLSDTLTWEDALINAENLSTAGFNDWRLPNIKELQSISNPTAGSPAISTAFFNLTGNRKYWSSTTLPNHTEKAWYWDSRFGITTYDLKTARDYVLCVRTQTEIISGITANSDEHISLQAFPNPFENTIHLSAFDCSIYSELRNSEGKLIYAGFELEKCDLTDIKKGLYFLSIYGDEIIHQKLIKR